MSYKERHRYNRLILKEIEQEIENAPDQRFWQLLFNLSVINGFPTSNGGFTIMDEYNRESEDIYNRIIQTKKERDEQQQ